VQNFFGNWLRWLASALALPDTFRTCRGKRLRLDTFLNVAAKIVRSARRLVLRLPRAYRHDPAFIDALATLRALPRFARAAPSTPLVGGVLGVVFGVGFGLRFHLSPSLVVPAVLSVLAALGYGLVITGLTVRVASIGAVTHVANMAVQFFGGMLVPVALFPHGLEIFTRFLPITLGVEALDASLAGEPLAAIWAEGTLPLLVAYALASLALGMVVYSRNIRRARRQGGLAPR
jgi:ABC-2 type transport system permease protein